MAAASLAVQAAAPAGAQELRVVEGQVEMVLDQAAPELSCVVVRTSGDAAVDGKACEAAVARSRTGPLPYPKGTYLYGDEERRPTDCRVKGKPLEKRFRAMCQGHVAAMGKARFNRAIDPKSWLQPSDLGSLTGRAGRGGLKLGIGADGRATYCVTVQPSGNSELDRRACEALLRRARYEPALNSAGVPTPSDDYRPYAWLK